MIGESLAAIRLLLERHFAERHDGPPSQNPFLFDWSDFEVVRADLYSDEGRPFAFTTHRFYSDDYCIAVITDRNYDYCTGVSSRHKPEEVQKYLSLHLEPYFES